MIDSKNLTDFIGKTAAASHPSLVRGQVWCTECGGTQKVNSGDCMQTDWPKCCGSTMTIDSPEEKEKLAESLVTN